MTPKDRIERDLQAHFSDQLRDLIRDSSDTMERIDIERGNIAASLMTALMREVCGAAWSLQLPEEVFMDLCQMSYRHYLPEYSKLEQALGKRKRPAQGAKPGV